MPAAAAAAVSASAVTASAAAAVSAAAALQLLLLQRAAPWGRCAGTEVSGTCTCGPEANAARDAEHMDEVVSLWLP